MENTYLNIFAEIDWSMPGPFGVPIGFALFAMYIAWYIVNNSKNSAANNTNSQQSRSSGSKTRRTRLKKSVESIKPCDSCGGEVREWSGEMRCWRCGTVYKERSFLLSKSSLLLSCSTCNGSVSANAVSCPHCGEPNPAKN